MVKVNDKANTILKCAKRLGKCDGKLRNHSDISRHEKGITALVTLAKIGNRTVKKSVPNAEIAIYNEITQMIKLKLDQIAEYIRDRNTAIALFSLSNQS